MQSRRSKLMESPFFVGSTINHFANLRPPQGAGTHYTRLNGNVKYTFVQVFSTQQICSRSDSLHFGMGSYISERFVEIVRTGNDTVLRYNHSTNRHFAFMKSQFCFQKCLFHKIFVVKKLHLIVRLITGTNLKIKSQ